MHAKAFAPALYLPSLLFETAVRMRNRLYDSARLEQHRLPGPVISVGNLTVGGTGKTPLVVHIAGILLRQGRIPAILTRGYGREKPGRAHVVSPMETIPAPALVLGDEPALIRRRIPSIWMGVSKDRYVAGAAIARRQSGAVFLLDDGFQHRKLWRDLDIVVVDGARPLRSHRLFPLGALREPLTGLRRCHVIVINEGVANPAPERLEAELAALHPGARIFHCTQSVEHLIPFESWKDNRVYGNLPEPVNSAFLVAAIGAPERFRDSIARLGIAVRGVKFYRDHARLSRSDWQECIGEARRAKAEAIVVTEKDAVKVNAPPDFPLLVAVQTTGMRRPEEFEALLKERIEEWNRGNHG